MIYISAVWLPLIIWGVFLILAILLNVIDSDYVYIVSMIWGFISLICVLYYGGLGLKWLFSHIIIIT